MDLVSIETPSENDLIEELISGGMRMLPTYSDLEMGKNPLKNYGYMTCADVLVIVLRYLKGQEFYSPSPFWSTVQLL